MISLNKVLSLVGASGLIATGAWTANTSARITTAERSADAADKRAVVALDRADRTTDKLAELRYQLDSLRIEQRHQTDLLNRIANRVIYVKSPPRSPPIPPLAPVVP